MKKIIFTIIFMLATASCATILDSWNQTLIFDSNQKDVGIYIDREFACNTPCTVKVRKKDQPLLVVAKKEGFSDKVVNIKTQYSSTTSMNAVSTVTSSFGVTTDSASGKSREYRPGEVFITMYKKPKNEKEENAIKEQEAIYDFVTKNFDGIMIKKDYSAIMTLSELSKISEADILELLQSSAQYCEMEFLSKLMKKYDNPSLSNNIDLPYACEKKPVTKIFGVIPNSSGLVYVKL